MKNTVDKELRKIIKAKKQNKLNSLIMVVCIIGFTFFWVCFLLSLAGL